MLGSGLGTFDPLTFSNARTDQEGFSHAQLGFPGQQEQLLDAVLSTGVPTVLIMSSGQVFLLPPSTLSRTSAVFHSWLGGEYTGDALVEMLFGETNPSGKLTVTIPEADGAFPVAYDFFPSDDAGGFGTATLYDWHWPQLARTASLRFGYGLSYTEFDIADVEASTDCGGGAGRVTATVSNVGAMAGKEVVQLYFRPDVSIIEFPVMKLIRFIKIDLEAGETGTVEFHVSLKELGYFVNSEWQVDGGDYTFWLGSSSREEDLVKLNVSLSA
jgi:beta-glucosidase